MITRRSTRLAAAAVKHEQDETPSKPATASPKQATTPEPPKTSKPATRPKPATTTKPATTPKPTTAPKSVACKQNGTKKAVPATKKTQKQTPLSKRTKRSQQMEQDDDNKLDDEAGPAKKKRKLKLTKINFESFETDPIIEHLKKLSANQQVNVDAEILDQIALEGLSGITLGRLFLILNCTKDQNCQMYVWSVIVKRYLDRGVQAFYRDTEKSQTDIDKGGVVIDREIRLPEQTVRRIAKVDSLLYPVQDGPIMGSCANYLARVDITRELIEISGRGGAYESMQLVHHQYGLANVFFVASQTLRARAILPNWVDPNFDVKLREYCTLELIGKSRTLGTVFPNDKSLGRYRIMLMAKGFITQFQETNCSPIEHHLKRFSYVKRSCENSSLSKAKEAAANACVRPGEEDDSSEQPLSALCFDPHKLKFDRSILSMVYEIIADSDGMTQLDVRRRLNLPKFHVRNHLKNLLSIKMICSHMHRDQEKPYRVYKAAHKSRRRRRVREDFEKPTGIMAKWDEADLRAKRIIGHKRSSFSQAEDSLLILCRITSILIEPGSKLSWCVHKRLVRDIMHAELVEAHDKTSDACLRRIKYLKRLPNNIMSINELTAELRDDPELRRLTRPEKKPSETGDKTTANDDKLNEDKLNKKFVRVLKTIRAKIPNLLGVSSTTGGGGGGGGDGSVYSQPGGGGGGKNATVSASVVYDRAGSIQIESHEELKQKYELVDCQSVASILRAPTYEQPKNVVDVKFNNACLVTMAFILSSCLAQESEEEAASLNSKRTSQWLLDKFYSGLHDKLISSVLSKLNKRSLLTRKCPPEQATLYKPRTKMSLKLNQSVLFLLNRYQSSSLMQLARPISQLYEIDLSESNEMLSFALLTSLYSSGSFNLDLKLKIPNNVVGIDQGNENFKSLCEKANDSTREILARFISRCGESLPLTSTPMTTTAAAATSNLTASAASATTATTTTTTTTTTLAREKGTGNDGGGEEGASGTCEKQQQQREWDYAADATMTAGAAAAAATVNSKMDDSRRALFLLRHELKSQALDKCGSLSDCLIVQPCNVKFFSEERLELKREPMDTFLERAQPIELAATVAADKAAADGAAVEKDDQQQQQQQHKQRTSWLIQGFRLPEDIDNNDSIMSERDFETKRVALEYSARLWKGIDGSVHMLSLFKLMESLLSWIIVFPGAERDLLQREFSNLMPEEHLHELLELMESLDLISSQRLAPRQVKARLFGYRDLASTEQATIITYEPSAGAFVRYCQLLNYCSTK